ncbi:MAG: hypothetical protein ACYS29_00585 [Planctomycetota bacterium]|jgi:hypothetical protein
MFRNVKYGKILVVVFLTALIWVVADLAKTEELTVPHATLTVVKTGNPNIWVSFDGRSSISIDEIRFTGAASRIDQVQRRLKRGKPFQFDFDAAQEGIAEPNTYQQDLLQFLRKDKLIKQLGLKIESCKPKTVSVTVVQLVKRYVPIQCVDENLNPVVAAIDPTQIEMSVPEDREYVAQVQLGSAEIEQARGAPIHMKPYIELAQNETRWAEKTVKIIVQDLLEERFITGAVLGFTFSENLQGQYKVEVDNLSALMTAIKIKATPKAKRAYENMRYQVVLEIYDSDIATKPGEPFKTRPLIYNFPTDFVRLKEIQLDQEPEVAQFRLIPLTPPEGPTASSP